MILAPVGALGKDRHAVKCRHQRGFALNLHADVAESVDALVSGTSDSDVVGVQVSPSA